MARARTYSPPTRDAARLLGLEVARARRARRWSVAELAERVGVSHVTVRSVEKGALSVSIGTAFEIATTLGIDLFGTPEEVERHIERGRDRLALLPASVRHTHTDVDDDF
ncbi:helix-turn-helix transcriptional regulator [Nocardioides sp. W7]|uniref:helix-turn-helix transcriptional regulator n=1 Tax=Nocardioides sp. W7 TaxID=2931390 RepID=UPI002469A513|nr:helix-turn-helix transcriptional regulator [Nocardioides sp. W7]